MYMMKVTSRSMRRPRAMRCRAARPAPACADLPALPAIPVALAPDLSPRREGLMRGDHVALLATASLRMRLRDSIRAPEAPPAGIQVQVGDLAGMMKEVAQIRRSCHRPELTRTTLWPGDSPGASHEADTRRDPAVPVHQLQQPRRASVPR